MSPVRLRVLCCLALLSAVGPASATDGVAKPSVEVAPASSSLEVKGWATSWSWSEGLHYGIDVPDVNASWNAGGLRWRPLLRGDLGVRAAIDAAGVASRGGFVELDDDVQLRRGYVYANGDVQGLWKPLSFKFELGSVNGKVSIKNASFAVHEIPYAGTFRLGTFDAPMSLSFLTSSRATPLMERGMVVDTLAPHTLSGLQLSNWLPDERVTWAFGLFSLGRDADNGDSSNAPARLVGRSTWAPWQSAGQVLHVGLSASWAYSPAENIHFRATPESFLAPLVVDTGDIEASQSVVVGLEGAWVRGRLSVQGEYLNALVLRDGGNDLDFGGFYLMASWFLTDDTRSYEPSLAAFGSLQPTHPLSWSARQLGAVETALRWSYVDLTDADVRGGQASVATSGLNWYWNRYVRLQINVGWSHATGGPHPGDAAILQTRFDLMI